MLSASDLIAKLLGWLSLWGATSLFFPEIMHAWIHKPKQLRIDTYIFYWCWWIGDGCHLIGLHMGHGKVTQLALTWSILAFDSILIVMLTLFACINRPRGRPLWIKRVKKPTIETLVKASSSHPSTGAPPSRSNDDSQPPPGSSSIEADLASLVNGKGKSSKGFTGFLAKHSRSFEFVLIGSLFVAVVVVWGILDLRVRETANPDPPSPKPSTSIENLAWGLAFGAVPLWVGPRIVNIVVSLKDGVPEGITTAAVCLGGSSHICNIASVLMINNTADSRRAESPFIATAVACVFFDTIRLALKYYITRRQGSATKPERNPHWLEKQEDFKYDNKSKGLHRYGTPRIDMPLDSKRLSFSDSQSSAEESSSSQGALESHQKLLARTALLPLPGRKRDDPNLSANVTFLEEQNRRRKLKQNEYELEERRQILLKQIGELGDMNARDRKLDKMQERLKRDAPRSVVSLRRDRSRRRDSARESSSLERSSNEGSNLGWSEEGDSSSFEDTHRPRSVRPRR